MKIVVIGGTGLIGSRVVSNLMEHGCDAVAAAPDTGVNALSGEGLADALAGADVVVAVAQSPSFADDAVLEFFETSTRNILDAGVAAGVGHHVALSVVGAERMADSGYMRAKCVQEDLIKSSSAPYTIVRSAQFFEFGPQIVDDARDGDTVRVPATLIQPIAADDVGRLVCDVALAAPLNSTIEIAGPQALPFEDFVGRILSSQGDQSVVVADSWTPYFGARLNERTLLPGDNARLGATQLEDWLRQRAKTSGALAQPSNGGSSESHQLAHQKEAS